MIDDARDKSAACEPEVDAAGRQPAAAPICVESSASLADSPQLATGANFSATPSPAPDVATPDAALEGGVRGGSDARRRGWFWHWNSIVTQYAPLVGLKGIGLLNSYTVWTDRRDESPHRGFAFPSQQSEADFYGEERSELITINKLLVTLDLLEIRKEMFTRVDDAGRRWRVPHNLYRVKDRDDGWHLRVDDVLRVAQMAAADAAVFRYVRRVFSPRFKPIDRDNPWHAILEAVQHDPTWQALRQRAEETERRASARSRAGHAARAQRGTAAAPAEARAVLPPAHDALDARSAAELTTGQTTGDMYGDDEQRGVGNSRRSTSVANGNHALAQPARDVARSNTGLVDAHGAAVDACNTAWPLIDATNARPSNAAGGASVAPSNTTEYQAHPTTTTTTTTRQTAADARDGGDEDTQTLAAHAATDDGGMRLAYALERVSDMGVASSAEPPPPATTAAPIAGAAAAAAAAAGDGIASIGERSPAAEARRPMTIDDGLRERAGGATHDSAAEVTRAATTAQVALAGTIADEEDEDGAHERRWNDDATDEPAGATRAGRRRHARVGDAPLAGADDRLGDQALGAVARGAAALDAATATAVERTEGSAVAAAGVGGERSGRVRSVARPAAGGAVSALVECPSDADGHSGWQPAPALDADCGGGGGSDSSGGRARLAAELAGNGTTATGDRRAVVGAGVRDQQRRLADPRGGGPLGDPSDLVVSLFEAANDRRSTPLERILLAELERVADPAARADGADGATWVAAALRDAVAAGSRFVAPRRIQEIITRWATEATTAAGSATATTVATTNDATRLAASGVTAPAVAAGGETLAPRATAEAGVGPTRRRAPARAADTVKPATADADEASAPLHEHVTTPNAAATTGAPDAPPSVRLPGGASGAAVWRRTLEELARALDAEAFERLLAGSVIVGYREGTVEVRVATVAAADALSTGYRSLVERRLNAQLRQPVAARFSAASQPARVVAQAQSDNGAPAPPGAPLVVTPADLDLGRQLWRVALTSLVADVPADEAQRLANVAVLGQAADGALLLAAPTPQSARLLERRRVAVERVLAELLGRRVVIRPLGAEAWIVGD